MGKEGLLMKKWEPSLFQYTKRGCFFTASSRKAINFDGKQVDLWPLFWGAGEGSLTSQSLHSLSLSDTESQTEESFVVAVVVLLDENSEELQPPMIEEHLSSSLSLIVDLFATFRTMLRVTYLGVAELDGLTAK